MTELYLEDFTVGQSFGSGRRRIDEEPIRRFASDFDPQPFHLDDQAARDTILRSLAASGWHKAARVVPSDRKGRVVHVSYLAGFRGSRRSSGSHAESMTGWLWSGCAAQRRLMVPAVQTRIERNAVRVAREHLLRLGGLRFRPGRLAQQRLHTPPVRAFPEYAAAGIASAKALVVRAHGRKQAFEHPLLVDSV